MASIKISDLKIIDRNLYSNSTNFPVEISGEKLNLRGGINSRNEAIVAE